MRMIAIGCAFLTTLVLPTHAQIPGLGFEQTEAVDFDDAENPFFVLQQEEAREARERTQSVSAAFPRDKGSDRSAGQMFTGFFSEMFAGIRIRPRPPESWAKLEIEPAEFSVDDRREILARYWVVNNARRARMLEFPNSQRIEILVRDANGTVIERWSDDRPFNEEEGRVLVNPKERIEYTERIPTRDMVAGGTYTVEAWLVSNPEYGRTMELRPTGSPPPVPAPAETGAAPAGAGADS